MKKIINGISCLIDFLVYCNYRFFLKRDATPHFSAVSIAIFMPIIVVCMILDDAILKLFDSSIRENIGVFYFTVLICDALIILRYKDNYGYVDRIQPLLQKYNVDDWFFCLIITLSVNALSMAVMWFYLR